MHNELSYPLILPPWVWVCRFRKRCGYGVHSPYAFDFITWVVYEREHFYFYRELDLLLPWYVRAFHLRPQKLLRLLFRVANFAHPRRALMLGASSLAQACMKAAVPSCEWQDERRDGVNYDFVYLSAPADCVLDAVSCDAVLVLDHLRHNLAFWSLLLKDKRVVLSFDLYDVGILMFHPRFHRKDYTVNF